MSSIKENFIHLIENLPENVTIDELVYQIYLNSQVLKGKQQLRDGKGIPQEKIEDEIAQWEK